MAKVVLNNRKAISKYIAEGGALCGCNIMKVIPFPGTCKSEPVLPKSDSHKLHQGPVLFTCPHCRHKQEAVFNGMLFRSVEFHCGHCGQLFKVTNPGLASPTKQK